MRGTAPEIIPGLAGKRLAIGVEGSGSNGVIQYLLELNAADSTAATLQPIGGITAQRALLDVEVRLRSDPSSSDIERCRSRLQKIEDKVEELSVPIGYADTLYNMRLHLKLVQEKLEKTTIRRTAVQRDPK